MRARIASAKHLSFIIKQAVTSVRLVIFRLGGTVRLSLCLRLLGLMASAIIIVQLGRLYVRDFQFWVAMLGHS